MQNGSWPRMKATDSLGSNSRYMYMCTLHFIQKLKLNNFLIYTEYGMIDMQWKKGALQSKDYKKSFISSRQQQQLTNLSQSWQWVLTGQWKSA